VFGVSVFSRACVLNKDIDEILLKAPDYLKDTLNEVKTFKVEAKRSDKRFPLTSPQICRGLGEKLLDYFPHLTVDVHNPDVVVTVEIRDFGAYVHAGKIKGAGGMPVGSSGQASVLMSGGIDSPVAAYVMAKRGLTLDAIHFESPPYTSERAKQKVIKLTEIVGRYCGRIYLHVVPFTEIQEEIKKNCPEELFTIIMRRLMMRVAEKIANTTGSMALITGESLAQVASQTIQAMACTEAVVDMPVLRPLIGMDKSEIIAISQKIDTFETSILPYEDCCTVFTPRHPKTKPSLEEVALAEAVLPIDELVDRAVRETEKIRVLPKF
jgi:thiamine biosynthesis protein ThiI